MDALLQTMLTRSSPAEAEVVGPCPVCGHLSTEFQAYCETAYWQAMHRRAVARLAKLKQQNEALQAKLRLREQQLFGRKSEASNGAAETAPRAAATLSSPKRRRGQQPDKPPPKRRAHAHLPVEEETRDLAAADRCCRACGRPFAEFPGTEDSEILEIEVRAHRRLIRRKRYRPTCTCGGVPGIITAPPAPRVIPKCGLGVSIWVTVLLDKYLFARPTYRLLADLRLLGLDLPLGTITEGLRRIVPLFTPLYEALITHSQQQHQWHADETPWRTFVTHEGKVGYRWYFWVFHAEQVVVFVLSPSHAHSVPDAHFGDEATGMMVVDRYAAYPAMAAVQEGRIVLAFCWAHVRRDFLRAAQSWPTEQTWALSWIERIGRLYERNHARLQVRSQPALFAERDQSVRAQVAAMAAQRDAELGDAELHPARRKVLTSLQRYWDGLTVFLDHPEVPLDNNTAERAQRGPVVGRKNYYGSGARWSGQLAAMLFSLFQTLCLWHLNPRAWLTAYLEACAAAGGQAPPQPEQFLPWNLSDAQRRAWSIHNTPPLPPDTS